MAVKQMQQPWLWKRAYGSAVESYIGQANEVVLDYSGTHPKLRVMTGVTPGGQIITAEQIIAVKPRMTLPANGAVDVDLTPILQATANTVNSNDTARYGQWQIALNSNFSNIVIDTGPLEGYLSEVDLSIGNDSLVGSTLYYARMRHHLASGVITEYSTPISFTTTAASVMQQLQTITPAGLVAGDDFGYAIDVSANGEVMVVGAYLDDTLGTYAGCGYVFRKVNNSWVEEAKLLGSQIVGNVRSGNDVAISGDGTTIAVAAARQTSYQGAVYVFKREANVWVEKAILTALDAANSDYFGQSVDINHDGSRIAIGAFYDDEVAYNTGSIYVFHQSGATWTQTSKLTANDPEANDSLGYSVAISSDGTTLIAGTTRKGVNGNYIGAVYVYLWNGTMWYQAQKLTASDGISADYFGFSIATSSNGNVIAVGATGTDDKGSNSGSVYIFKKANGVWSQTTKLITAVNILSDQFGKRVALSGDGTILLVSSPYANINGVATGAGFLFKDVGSWVHIDTLAAADGSDGDMFGEMAGALSNDGLVAALGSYRKNSFAGAVYIFN